MIYLASPYTHPDSAVREARWREACRAAAWLHLRNWDCYCPIAETHGQTAYGCTLEWDAWADRDHWFLVRCDSLYILCLDGWSVSHGIEMERRAWLAMHPHTPVQYMEPTADGYEILTEELV